MGSSSPQDSAYVLVASLVTFVVLVVVLAYVACLLGRWCPGRGSRGCTERFEEAAAAPPYLSVVHVSDRAMRTPLPLVITASCPAALPAILADRLRPLLTQRRGEDGQAALTMLVEGPSDPAEGPSGPSEGPSELPGWSLTASDAPTLSRRAGPDTPEVVAPILAPSCRSALLLLTLRPGRGSIRHLYDLANAKKVPAAPAAKKVRVICDSALEAGLFGVAWGVCFGVVDPAAASSAFEVVVSDALTETLALGKRQEEPTIFVSWGPDPEARLAAARSRWPDARAVPYHPSDVSDVSDAADGHALASSAAVVQALDPLLRATVFRLGAQDDGGDGSMTLLSCPALVVLVRPRLAKGTREEQQQQQQQVAVWERTAGEVASDLLEGDADAVATLTYLELRGGVPILDAARRLAADSDAARVAKITKRWGSGSSDEPYNRPTVSILEQFVGGDPASASASAYDPPLELIPDHDVSLLLAPERSHSMNKGDLRPVPALPATAGGVRRATLLPAGSRMIDGVVLRRGDRVVLSRQERATEENGTWIVVEADPQLLLQSPLALPDFFLRQQPGRKLPHRTGLVPPPPGQPGGAWHWQFSFVLDPSFMNPLRSGDVAAWTPLPGSPHGIVEVVTEGDSGSRGIRVVVTIPAASVTADLEGHADEREWLHPLSACSQDVWRGPGRPGRKHPERPGRPSPSQASSRRLCHEADGVWDRPCERDADCPFVRTTLDVAGTHAIHRGGCTASGYCEMPVGVRRAGFRACQAGTAGCLSGAGGTSRRPVFPLEGP